MKNRIATLLLSLACVVLCSCTGVLCKRPVGDEPVLLDKGRWNGSWTTPEGDVMFTRVVDSAKGLVEIAMISLEEKEIKMEKRILQIRKSGDWLWASSKEDSEANYEFGRISEPDEEMIFWLPKAAAFIERVRKGELKGLLPKDSEGKETGTVVLDALSAENIKDIEAGKWGNVFAWERPMVLRRLKPAK